MTAKRSRNIGNRRRQNGRQGKRSNRKSNGRQKSDEHGAFGYEGAAAYIGIGKSTLHALVASGDAPASVKVGRRRLFRREALDQWLRDLEAAQAGN